MSVKNDMVEEFEYVYIIVVEVLIGNKNVLDLLQIMKDEFVIIIIVIDKIVEVFKF